MWNWSLTCGFIHVNEHTGHPIDWKVANIQPRCSTKKPAPGGKPNKTANETPARAYLFMHRILHSIGSAARFHLSMSTKMFAQFHHNVGPLKQVKVKRIKKLVTRYCPTSVTYLNTIYTPKWWNSSSNFHQLQEPISNDTLIRMYILWHYARMRLRHCNARYKKSVLKMKEGFTRSIQNRIILIILSNAKVTSGDVIWNTGQITLVYSSSDFMTKVCCHG